MNAEIRELEKQLSVSLRRRVGGVEPSTPHTRGWYEEAGRLRRRNWVTAIAACVAILGVTVPVGINALPDRPGSTQLRPEGSPTPKLHKVSIDIAKLPQGPAPEALWAADGVLHDGRKTIRPKIGPININRIVRLGDGYAVNYSGKDDVDSGGTVWIGPDGAKRRVLPSLPVVSPDGKTAAFQGKTYDNDESADLEAMTVATGETKRVRIKKPTLAAPGAFFGDKILYVQGNGQRQIAGLWDPDTGKLTSVGTLLLADGAARADLQLLVRGKDAKDACSDIYAGDLRDRLWRTCDDDLVISFSPDGLYALAYHKKDLGGMDDNVTTFVVRDGRTGRPMLEIRGPVIHHTSVTTEADGSVIALAFQGNREALVRCTIDGKCERAADLRARNTFTVEGDY